MDAKVCNRCGGELVSHGVGKLKCRFCDSIFEEKVIQGEEGILLVNAYAQLRTGNTEEASVSFQSILDSNEECYEAYFGLALANHGIVYVEDKRAGKEKRVPTCYNISQTAFNEDGYFKKAIKYAPSDIAAKYASDVAEIDKIRNKWLEMTRTEPAYDVFICFKDTDDETKERTKDSIFLQDIYMHLMNKNLKVFFSRYSLADKISEDYEPYIYNALSTAKVMLVFGSKSEYLNARWLRNEWGRWWKRIDSGTKHKQSLIVAYKDMDVYDIPTALLRPGMQAVDMNKPTALPMIETHIQKVIAAVEAESGNTRVEIAGFSGKRATRVEGEKIEKKQLGTGGVRRTTKATEGAVNVREININTKKEVQVDDNVMLDIANDLLAAKQWKRAIDKYTGVLETEDIAAAHLGIMMAMVGVNNDADFIKNAYKLTDFSHFDGLVSNCSEEELNRAANLFVKAEKQCFVTGNVQAGLEYFKKLVAYNIPQRDRAINTIIDKINSELQSKNKKISAESLVDEYFKAIAQGDDRYITHCADVVDIAMTNARYDIARKVNNLIGEVDELADEYIYNNIRLAVSSDLCESRIVDIYRLPNFEMVDSLLTNTSTENAERYNRELTRAVLYGMGQMYAGSAIIDRTKIVDLFKIVISYTYKNYLIDKKLTNEAGFKFTYFTRLLNANLKKPMYSDGEIVALKEHILKTLNEDAVDEYAAYEIAEGVYYMQKNAFDKAKESFERSLELIPNDSNARILRLAATYQVTENDICAERADLSRNDKRRVVASNAIIHALLKKSTADVNKFVSEVEDILKYCLKQEDWQKDSQSTFYVKNMKLDEFYYNYLSTYKRVKSEMVFATVTRANLDLKYVPRTQFECVLKLFTDEVVDYLDALSSVKDITRETERYYNLLKYVDAENKTYMGERLKFMGDVLLMKRQFELADKFYDYALSEDNMDSELHWKKLHARLHAVNSIELVLSKEKIVDQIEYENVLKLVPKEERKTYVQVLNKQEHLQKKQNRALRALLQKRKDTIPASMVDELFQCDDGRFKRILDDLAVTDAREKKERAHDRAVATANAGVIGVSMILFLLSLALIAAAVLCAFRFDVLYKWFEIGDAGHTMHPANKLALLITAALALILQIVHLVKFSKAKITATLFAQIFAIVQVVLSDFILVQVYDLGIMGWGIAVGSLGYMISYMVRQFDADADFLDEVWAAFGHSIAIFLLDIVYIVLNLLLLEIMSRDLQILIMVLLAIAIGLCGFRLEEGTWKWFGICVGVLVAFGLVILLAGSVIFAGEEITILHLIGAVVAVAVGIGVLIGIINYIRDEL